jgi:hypothetical protein
VKRRGRLNIHYSSSTAVFSEICNLRDCVFGPGNIICRQAGISYNTLWTIVVRAYVCSNELDFKLPLNM